MTSFNSNSEHVMDPTPQFILQTHGIITPTGRRDPTLFSTEKNSQVKRNLSEAVLDTHLLRSIATDPDPIPTDRFCKPMWGSPNNRRSVAVTPSKVRQNLARLNIVPFEKRNEMSNAEAYQKVVELLDQTDLKEEKPEKYDHILEFFRIHLDIYGGVQKVEKHRRGRTVSITPAHRLTFSDSPNQRTNLVSPEKLSRPGTRHSPHEQRDQMRWRVRPFEEGEYLTTDEALKERSINAADNGKAGQRRSRKERAKNNQGQEFLQDGDFQSGSKRTGSPYDTGRVTASTQETPKEKDRRSVRSGRKDRLTKASEAGEEVYYARSPNERDLSQPKNATTTARKSVRENEMNKAESNKLPARRRATESMTKTTPENPKTAYHRLSLQRGGKPQENREQMKSSELEPEIVRDMIAIQREALATQQLGALLHSQTLRHSPKMPVEEARRTEEARDGSIPRESNIKPPKPEAKQQLTDYFVDEELKMEQPKPLPFRQQSRQEPQPILTEGTMASKTTEEDLTPSGKKTQEVQSARTTVDPRRMTEKQIEQAQIIKEDQIPAEGRIKSKTATSRTSVEKKGKPGAESQIPSGALFKQPRVSAADKGTPKQSIKGSSPKDSRAESSLSLEEKKEEGKLLAQGIEIREEVLAAATRVKGKTVQPKKSSVMGVVKDAPGSPEAKRPQSRTSIPTSEFTETQGAQEERNPLKKPRESKLTQSREEKQTTQTQAQAQTRPKSKTQLEKPIQEKKGRDKRLSEKGDLSGKGGVTRTQESEELRQSTEEDAIASQPKQVLSEQTQRPSTRKDKLLTGKSAGMPEEVETRRPQHLISSQETPETKTKPQKQSPASSSDQQDKCESKKLASVSKIKEAAAEEYVPQDDSEEERIIEEFTPLSKHMSSYPQSRRLSQESDPRTFTSAIKLPQQSVSSFKDSQSPEAISPIQHERIDTPEERIVEDDVIEYTEELQSHIPVPQSREEDQYRRASQQLHEKSAGVDEKEPIQLKRKFIDRLLNLVRPQRAFVSSRRGTYAFVQKDPQREYSQEPSEEIEEGFEEAPRAEQHQFRPEQKPAQLSEDLTAGGASDLPSQDVPLQLKKKFVDRLLALVRPQKAVVVSSRKGSLAFVQRASVNQAPIFNQPIAEEDREDHRVEDVEEPEQFETITEGRPSGTPEKLPEDAPIHLKKKFLDRMLSKVRPNKAVVTSRRGTLAFVEKAAEVASTQGEEDTLQQLHVKSVAITPDEQPQEKIEQPGPEAPIQLKRKFIERLLGKVRPQNATIKSRRGTIAAIATTIMQPPQKPQPKSETESRASLQGDDKPLFVSGLGKDTSYLHKQNETEETDVKGEGLQSHMSPTKPFMESLGTTIFGSSRPSVEPQKFSDTGFFGKLGLDQETTQSIVRAIFSNMQPEISRIRYRRGQFAQITTAAEDDQLGPIPETLQKSPSDQLGKSTGKPVAETIEVSRAKLRQAVNEIKPETARFRFKTPQIADIERFSQPSSLKNIYEEEKIVGSVKTPQITETQRLTKAPYEPEKLHDEDKLVGVKTPQITETQRGTKTPYEPKAIYEEDRIIGVKTPQITETQRLTKTPYEPKEIYEEEKGSIYKPIQRPETQTKPKMYNAPDNIKLSEALQMTPEEISLIRQIEDEAARKIQEFFKEKIKPKRRTKKMRSRAGSVKAMKETPVQTEHDKTFPRLETQNELYLRYQNFLNRLTKTPDYILAIHLTNIYLFAREELQRKGQR